MPDSPDKRDHVCLNYIFISVFFITVFGTWRMTKIDFEFVDEWVSDTICDCTCNPVELILQEGEWASVMELA